MQAEGLNQVIDRPGGRKGDQCEKKKFGGNTGPLALREALADEAKGAQAHRSSWIRQLTVSDIAA